MIGMGGGGGGGAGMPVDGRSGASSGHVPGSGADNVPALVAALVQHMMTTTTTTTTTTPARVASVHTFCLSILASSLRAPAPPSLVQLNDLIKLHAQRLYDDSASATSSASSWAYDKDALRQRQHAAHIEECIHALQLKRSIKYKSNVLYVLYQCRDLAAASPAVHIPPPTFSAATPILSSAAATASTSAATNVSSTERVSMSLSRPSSVRHSSATPYSPQPTSSSASSSAPLPVSCTYASASTHPSLPHPFLFTGSPSTRLSLCLSPSHDLAPQAMGADDIPQNELLRDLVFVFQGIDGRYVRYQTNMQPPQFHPAPGVELARPTYFLLMRIIELGTLYRHICTYINRVLERQARAAHAEAHQMAARRAPARARTGASVGAFDLSAKGHSRHAGGAGGAGAHAHSPHDADYAASATGQIEQSFVAALQTELSEYHRLIAVLEVQIHTALAAGTAAHTFSLHRLFLWIQSPLARLRRLSHLIELTQRTHGGELATVVSAYQAHADPVAHALSQRILRAVCVPLFGMIQTWICTGQVRDPYHEFFIVEDESAPLERLWHDKYQLCEERIPSFIGYPLAREILNAGKTVSFIRTCCAEPRFVAMCKLDVDASIDSSLSVPSNSMTLPPSASSSSSSSSTALTLATSSALNGTSTTTTTMIIPTTAAQLAHSPAGESLVVAVRACALQTNTALMDLLSRKYVVHQHALALKKYLLMSQGDFITHLMEATFYELDKPARSLTQRQLGALLDTAMRACHRPSISSSSSSSFSTTSLDTAAPSYLTSRVGIKLLEARADSDCGWDVFSLDYVIDSPLHVIFSRASMQTYYRIFNFLWQVKRVEYALSSAWRRQMSQNFKLRELLHIKSLSAPSPAFVAALSRVLRRSQMVRHEMHHVVRNLHSYLMFEVLECSWDVWCAQVERAVDMEHMIAAQQDYLQHIVEKCMLDGPAATLSVHLLRVFDTILAFTKVEEQLYKHALAEVQRREEYRARAAAATSWTSQAGPSSSSAHSRASSASISSSRGDVRKRSVGGAAISAAPSAAAAAAPAPLGTLEDGVFAGMLPTFATNVEDAALRFRTHLDAFFDCLRELYNSHTVRQNRRHRGDGRSAWSGSASSSSFADRHGMVVDEQDERGAGAGSGGGGGDSHAHVQESSSALRRRPDSLSVLQDLDFLRFRLDFNEHFSHQRAIGGQDSALGGVDAGSPRGGAAAPAARASTGGMHTHAPASTTNATDRMQPSQFAREREREREPRERRVGGSGRVSAVGAVSSR